MNNLDDVVFDHKDKGSFRLSFSEAMTRPDAVFVLMKNNAVVLDKSEVDDLITWLQYWRLTHE